MPSEYDFECDPGDSIVDSHNSAYDTPLHFAAMHNDAELAAALVRKGANFLRANLEGLTPLDVARAKQFTDVVRVFTDAAKDFGVWCSTSSVGRDQFGYTKLMRAAQRGDEKVVRLLLSLNADVNLVSSEGVSALMLAAFAGNLNIVKLLIKAGADPNLAVNNRTACDLARLNGHLDIVAILFPITVGPKSRPPKPTGTVRGSIRRSRLIGLQKSTTTLFNSPTGRHESTEDLRTDSLDEQMTNLQEIIIFSGDSGMSTPTQEQQQNFEEVGKSIREAGGVPEQTTSKTEYRRQLSSQTMQSNVSPVVRAFSTDIMLPAVLSGKTAEQASQEERKVQAMDNIAVKLFNDPSGFSTHPSGYANNNGQTSPATTVTSSSTSPPLLSPSGAQTPNGAQTPRDFAQALTDPLLSSEELIGNVLLELETYLEAATAERTTVIGALYNAVVQSVVQLITAVTNRFHGQFVDITAQTVHEVGEIVREIREAIKKDMDKDKDPSKDGFTKDKDKKISQTKSVNPVFIKLNDLIKDQDNVIQNLALKVKVASGVWPPPNAMKEMVGAAYALCMSVRKLVNGAHDANLFELNEEEARPEEPDIFDNAVKRLNYREYQRQQNLKLIGEISSVNNQKKPQPVEEEDDDVSKEFLDLLDSMVKVYVTAMVELKKSFEIDAKESFLPNAEQVTAEALSISKQIDERLSSIKPDENAPDNGQSVRILLRQKILDIPLKNADLISKTKLTQGVWPPPNAKENMMAAAVAVTAAIKDLVSATKAAILEFKEIWVHKRETEKKEKADWEAKLLQSVKIQTLDLLVAQQQTLLTSDLVEINLSEDESKLLENESDIEGLIFDDEITTTGKRTVRGGTLDKLVVRLTYFKYPDADFRRAFLLTYQSFTTPVHLLQLLIEIYEAMPPSGLHEQQFQIYLNKKIMPTRLRVFNVLKAWIEDHFEDWAENADLIKLFRDFVEQRMVVDMEKAKDQLMKLLRDKLEGLKRKSILTLESKDLPIPILPKSIKGSHELETFLRNEEKKNWMNIDPLEFARQLTRIEFSMYEKIQAKECLNQGWNGKKKYMRSPNITNMIDFTNQVSAWVATKILESDQVRVRFQTLKHFVEVAQRCRELNNFNTCTSIMAALESSPVHRLKKTWEAFYDKRNKVVVGYYEDLLQLLNAKGNYATYRKVLHQVNPPVVPFLGVYLTDLTFIEDGNSDFMPNSKVLINFDKRKKISKSIEEIKMYQQIPYFLMDVVQIQNFICSVRGLDERLLYKRSLEVEPREEEVPV